ncbi:MAG TPA: hypothetical protein VJP59_03580 [Gemmatimonadota bacterium]|nr:hypothetical protein [Gemmatimonadota bacterium]
MSAGALSAGAGGACALAASALLPFHAGGGLGGWIAWLFLVAGLLLAAASMAFAARFPRHKGGLRSWAVLGAAGFAVSGYGLVGDLIESPLVAGEIAAVVALGLWWGAVGVLGRPTVPKFAAFSLVSAAGAALSLLVQLVWTSPPAGAIPVRFAYILWAPWGLALGAVLAGRNGPSP